MSAQDINAMANLSLAEQVTTAKDLAEKARLESALETSLRAALQLATDQTKTNSPESVS